MGLVRLASVVVLAGCAAYRGGGRSGVSFTVGIPVDSALRIAATQLQLHGYTADRQSRMTVVTRPRAVPQEARAAAANQPAQYWVVRVDASVEAMSNDTRLRVSGWLLPQGATAATTGENLPAQEPTPVTSENRTLFSEIEAIAGWVRDAANRRGSSS